MSLHCATPTPLAATRSLLCVPPGPARAQPPRSKPDARQLERPGAAGAGVGAHSPVGRLRRRVGADGPGGASLLRPWIRRVRTRMRALRPRRGSAERAGQAGAGRATRRAPPASPKTRQRAPRELQIPPSRIGPEPDRQRPLQPRDSEAKNAVEHRWDACSIGQFMLVFPLMIRPWTRVRIPKTQF